MTKKKTPKPVFLVFCNEGHELGIWLAGVFSSLAKAKTLRASLKEGYFFSRVLILAHIPDNPLPDLPKLFAYEKARQ